MASYSLVWNSGKQVQGLVYSGEVWLKHFSTLQERIQFEGICLLKVLIREAANRVIPSRAMLELGHCCTVYLVYLGQYLGLCQAVMPDGSPHHHQRKGTGHKARHMKCLTIISWVKRIDWNWYKIDIDIHVYSISIIMISCANNILHEYKHFHGENKINGIRSFPSVVWVHHFMSPLWAGLVKSMIKQILGQGWSDLSRISEPSHLQIVVERCLENKLWRRQHFTYLPPQITVTCMHLPHTFACS